MTQNGLEALETRAREIKDRIHDLGKEALRYREIVSHAIDGCEGPSLKVHVPFVDESISDPEYYLYHVSVKCAYCGWTMPFSLLGKEKAGW